MGDYQGILDTTEQSFGLPKGVLAAMIAQESGGYVWSYRYEAQFFANYILGRSRERLRGHWPKSISVSSERIARATSFGLMQVMGQVAREHGFMGESLLELCLPEIGVYYGAKHLKGKLRRYNFDLAKGLSAYNAGSYTTSNFDIYVKPILDRMKNGQG